MTYRRSFLIGSILNGLAFCLIWLDHGFFYAMGYYAAVVTLMTAVAHIAPRFFTRVMFQPDVAKEVNDVLYPETRS
jgi:hypothetical protein